MDRFKKANDGKRRVDGEGGDKKSGGMADLFGEAARHLAGGGQPGAVQPSGLAGQGVNAAAQANPVDPSRCEQLVERILVSEPGLDGGAEVRIKIDPSLLHDTEVILTRAGDGSLGVEFRTDNIDSQRFLMPNLSELRQRLADRTGAEVGLRMTESNAGTNAGGDTGDGRSRNRRSVYEENQD